MTDKHYYGNYEVVEERESQKYVATIKIHNMAVSYTHLTLPTKA